MCKTQKHNFKKNIFPFIALYFVIAVLFYGIAKNELSYRISSTDMLTPTAPSIGEINTEMVIEQNFSIPDDEILSMTFYISTFARENTSSLTFNIFDSDEKIFEQTVSTNGMIDNEKHTIYFDEPLIGVADKNLVLQITTIDGEYGNAVALWYGNTASASKVEINQFLTEENKVRVNGVPQNGKLCFSMVTLQNLWFGAHYWKIVFIVFAALALYTLYAYRYYKKGKFLYIVKLLRTLQTYKFLIKQLVMRDFKTKYKRSVLGILWSFLNPILTMFVQYIVFSTLFKSNVPNFVVYLLSGIVCFSFFSEATSMGLGAIVQNSSLITKVYVPKYIYPVTRVLSSTVNLALALIPLLITVVASGTRITSAILLLPFPLLCLILFSLGMSFILSSLMVFFRDTQFLWGVINMLWMYMTPIFYPDTIIPAQYLTIYKMNPLYHVIRFIRIILIDGVSPEPKAYALCFILAVIPLAIGLLVFKKTQDKFVLHL